MGKYPCIFLSFASNNDYSCYNKESIHWEQILLSIANQIAKAFNKFTYIKENLKNEYKKI